MRKSTIKQFNYVHLHEFPSVEDILYHLPNLGKFEFFFKNSYPLNYISFLSLETTLYEQYK